MRRSPKCIWAGTALCVALLLPAAGYAQQEPAAEPAAPAGGIVHTVAAGDTLWDLSAKYLGTPWKWPEIWERNRFVTNPHYIYPGIRVVILPPPPREVTMLVEPPPAEPSAGSTGPAAEASAPAPESAPSEPPAAEPMAPAPPRERFLDILPAEYVRAGEFVREAPTGVGRIAGGRDPKVGFTEEDTVYLRLDQAIPAGQLLGVYRVRGPIAVPGERSHSGYLKYLIGVLQVGPIEDGELTAKVRQSFEDLTRADLVSEEIPGYAPVRIVPGEEGLSVAVITGQTLKAELSTGDFVYLNRGASAGVTPGNVFRVLAPTGIRAGTPLESKGDVRTEVARVVVVRANADFATAYVDRSSQSFPAGVLALRGIPAR